MRRKKIQVREMLGMSRNTVFFSGYVQKRRVRRDLETRWTKLCTTLRQERGSDRTSYASADLFCGRCSTLYFLFDISVVKKVSQKSFVS